MELLQSKSILAKLMATENLIVEQRNVRTASFDVKNRILVIPTLDSNISSDLYDLLVGHEVGHALYTPEEGLIKSSELELTHSVLNVVEDARIERKMKIKYPGLKQPMILGYKDLTNRNFFGTENIDINSLNFIDRTNMYFKLGVSSNIKFNNDTELELINDVDSTESFDDVLIVTKKIMDYLNEEAETNKEEEIFLISEEDEEDEEEEGDEDDHDYKENDDYEDNDEQENVIESLTDKFFSENQKKLYSSDGTKYYYGNVPDVNLSKMIVPHDKLWDDYKHFHTKIITNGYIIPTNIKQDFQTFKNDSKKVVAYLVKEFELKKNAEQLKRTSIAKTGELNENALFSYKFADDIFKKISVVPNGKSHGLIMFIDWSGSMTNNLNNTVKQLLNLVLFCKQIKIPFEVYAFTTRYIEDQYVQEFNENDIVALSDTKQLNILSSTMSTTEFLYAASMLLFSSNNMYYSPPWFRLGNTPLDASIITAMKLVPKFKKDYKLQIVNTVFLTDGMSDDTTRIFFTKNGRQYIGNGDENYSRHDKSLSFIIRHPKTKHQEVIKNAYNSRKVTTAYLKMLKSVTGCNIIGFFILNNRDINSSEVASMFSDRINFETTKSELRAKNYLVLNSEGYDDYYLIRSEGLNINNKELTVKENASTRGLVTSFSKFVKSRLTNRIILNRFIHLIS